MQKRNVYAVPDLPVKEIMQYFSEMEINIKASDILKPTPQSTQRIYEILLEVYCGIRTSDMVPRMENTEMFEESLSYLLLQKRMSSFLRRIGIDNFGLKDLAPDSKRLIGILSVIVNFSMFRDNKRHVYERVCQMNDEKLLLRNEIDEKVHNAKKELERCERDAKKSVEEAKEIEREISVLESELKDFYKHQRALVQETERVKAERNECSDKLSSLRLMLLNLNQEITCLKTQVVSDPTKLMELLDEMRCLISKENEIMRGLEAKRISLKERIEFMELIKEDTMKAITLSLSNKEADKAIDRTNREISELEVQIKNLDSGINALKIRLNHVNRQISHIESKIFNLQDNDKRCSEEISAKLEKLKNNYGIVSDERNSIRRKIEENVRLTKNIEYELVKKRNEHINDITAIQSALCRLKDDVFNYFAEAKGVIDKSMSS
ncbi:Ndc80p-complex mitotic spindle protein [Encephalitozoon hellem ATCC 50504]|uniref:Kinetochore Nuf2-like protein n=1 Tax=Encephalitozoon hellem TaxID=27973 RepID=A0A9Q9C6T6_ENCHE|nr:Ndc80p-complex mitotic spindle protein [Encephalitozoon hellem ATCC 50504]AFM99064.1 Ndc80p-complex mitotic spindle protein [Encephalitozoon hellem ATCC 50504]UTX42470.1 putative kinetochore protein NUF2 [Encephalitozoon hellem]WEL37916.1 kinetochore Nuf2-like protein [Encephalitozoon hellem]|eukprot:XP_003888045.1 Ndc80p-complex mitotic spindle protein [Encephalitozoon hellem ATCC 50504]